MVWIAIGLVLAIVAVVAGIIISRRSGSALIEERLGITAAEKSARAADFAPRSTLTDTLNRALASRGVGANLATQLARANLKFTVGEFLALTIILIIGLGAAAYLLRRDFVITVIACLVGFFGPWVYVSLMRGQRLRAFNDQLSDTINLMVNGIRAGYSVMQAMEAVSEEMGPPISEEFGRVVKEVQLGLTLEQALDNMLRRITSDDLDMMITAIKVQREVGGNLAEVLDSISYTIRERVRIKGEIKALTSYGRGAGNLLSALPIILSVVIYLISPDFMSQLFTDPCGWIMIGISIVGIIVGYLIIRKIVDIEV
ncbi:MAG: type II secretion system F family protein [Anaerolineae bacterium]|nr:type II secretion system F family protein [Anaerolineae bacterium]